MNNKFIPSKKVIAAGALQPSVSIFTPFAALADTGTVTDAIKAANGTNGNGYITIPATFGFSS